MGARGVLKLPSHLAAVPTDVAGTVADHALRLAPLKPAAVAENEALSALWDEIVPQLDETGLVAPSDGPTVELMLRSFLLARKASEEVTSVTVADHGHGGVKKHPAESIFRAESVLFLEFAKQCGMTFVSRARTPAAKGGDDAGANPFAAASGG